MRKPTNKKSILMELPVEEVVEEQVEEEPLNEVDIFKVEPIKNEMSITMPEEDKVVMTETKPVKVKKPRSLAQQAALAKGRQKRLDKLYAKKQEQRDNTPIQIPPPSPPPSPVQKPQQTPPPPPQTPVNHKSNNDFESFLDNYQKMKKFESFVLEKNARKQKPVQPSPPPVQPSPQKPVQSKPHIDYAFSLNRPVRKRGSFY